MASEQDWFQQPLGEYLRLGAGGEMDGRKQKKGVGEGSDFHTLHTNPRAGLLITRIRRCF